ncbi:MAG: FapA family protein, partial [Leptospiraceae bacterium]|nr:FapA family protein [Leptospiraceae bacterium]
MNRVKAFLLEQEIELDKVEREQVEVLGDSVNECLLLAAKHLGKDIHELDYEVLQRGKKSLLFSEPFRIRVFPAELDEDLDILKGVDEALGTGGRLIDSTLKEHLEAKDKDGFFVIKNYRSGVYLSAHPPVGHGKHVNVEDVMKKFVIKGVTAPDKKKVQEIVSEERGELIRLGNSRLKAFMEAQIKVDIGTDWMKAHCTLIPPKPGGRDVEASDVIYELKKEKVEYGIKEDVIKKYIDEDRYNEPFIAAEGDPPAHGKNAHVVYHVRTEKQIKLKEDNFGRVDYRDLDLIENVVVGQLLAEKVPAEKGKYGRNLINEIIEARDGVDIQLNQGKGTILSEDKKRLTAEVNGQVLFVEGRISV